MFDRVYSYSEKLHGHIMLDQCHSVGENFHATVVLGQVNSFGFKKWQQEKKICPFIARILSLFE